MKRLLVVLAGFFLIVCGYVVGSQAESVSPEVKDLIVLAEQGDIEAQYNLALRYYNGPKYYNSQGVPQDYEEAAKWYQKVAERGDLNAQHTLGKMYELGQISKDNKEAAKWYQDLLKERADDVEVEKRIAAAVKALKLAEDKRKRSTWPGNLVVASPGGDGSDASYCYDFEMFKKYDVDELCLVYGKAFSDKKDQCISKRIKGTETEVGLREIRRICTREGEVAAWEKVKWFIRKERVKGVFR